jgi:hypothetical protein
LAGRSRQGKGGTDGRDAREAGVGWVKGAVKLDVEMGAVDRVSQDVKPGFNVVALRTRRNRVRHSSGAHIQDRDESVARAQLGALRSHPGSNLRSQCSCVASLASLRSRSRRAARLALNHSALTRRTQTEFCASIWRFSGSPGTCSRHPY